MVWWKKWLRRLTLSESISNSGIPSMNDASRSTVPTTTTTMTSEVSAPRNVRFSEPPEESIPRGDPPSPAATPTPVTAADEDDNNNNLVVPPTRPTAPTRIGRPTITRTPSHTYQPQRGPVAVAATSQAHPVRSDSVSRRAARIKELVPQLGPPAGHNQASLNHNHVAHSHNRSREVDPLYVAKLRSKGRDNNYLGRSTDNESDSESETPSSEGGHHNDYNDGILLPNVLEEYEPTDKDLEDPPTRERLEWFVMLQSVLTGDVVRQEKKRLNAKQNIEDIKSSSYANDLWMELKARACGRSANVQRKLVEDARGSLDSVINTIMAFKVVGASEAGGRSHIEQMHDVIAKIDKVESMYPSLRLLAKSHKSVHTSFIESVESIAAWHNTYYLITTQLQILKKWVGNDSLDFQRSKPLSPGASGLGEETSFLDRILKEDGLKPFHDEEERDKDDKVTDRKRTKHKALLPSIIDVVVKVKDNTLQFHESFMKRHFPHYDEEVLLLMTFPSRLIEDIIKVRLAYAEKVQESAQGSAIVQDQLISQFQLLLKLAIKIKNEYLELSRAEPGWELTMPLDETFDQAVLDALKFYFKLLNWKLRGNKNTFKEADLLFQEWEFINEVGSHLQRGPLNVAEHFSSLTHKALVHLSNTFNKELQRKPKESGLDMVKRYKQVLDSVRVRQRMLQRFSRMLSTNYENACDFNVPDDMMTALFDELVQTGHFQIWPGAAGHENILMLGSPSLWGQHGTILRILNVVTEANMVEDPRDPYILILRPDDNFVWKGEQVGLHMTPETLDLKPKQVRLVAGGSGQLLERAREAFIDRIQMRLPIASEQRSNFAKVHAKMSQIRTIAWRLSNTFTDSVKSLRAQTSGLNCQELIQTCFVFAAEFGQRSLLIMDSNRRQLNNFKLTRLSLEWVEFICDDCVASDRRTFRWAVQALEYVLGMTRGRQLLKLSNNDYQRLRVKVSGCMSILLSHFDIMGARSVLAAKVEQQRVDAVTSSDMFRDADNEKIMDDFEAATLVSQGRMEKLCPTDEERSKVLLSRQALGRVLEVSNEIDRSLMFLSSAASTSQFAIRWQLGNFVGGGTFGNVYSAVNLDTGQVMAVKEIRLQDPKQIPQIATQIKEEMAVLELLNHPNVVSYYGIEVHRDRVYIFMEFCSGGSLAQLLEHGRIEDEAVLMVYALQLLEGLAYLHASNITHRDIKPENILLDHNGVVKYVDFGAAKIIARQGKTLISDLTSTKANKSMTGTPMYMSPEVIQGTGSTRAGAADIWSLGCVILEMATGRRPWANLDNEWAIMYNIAQGNQPQMPTPEQLSPMGIDFLMRCFTRDPLRRATTEQLLQHEWILSIRQMVIDPDPSTPSDGGYSSLGSPSTLPAASPLSSVIHSKIPQLPPQLAEDAPI